ncbi:hypothetical protein ACWIWK_06335 [Helicobacter sp. 23-1048]
MEIIATMGESKEQVVFVIDKNNHITPKTAQDEENLINAWGINDDIFEAFLDFLNESTSDNDEKIALLSSPEKYEFLEGGEIYFKALYSFDSEPAQEQLESKIDEIVENAIFGYEELILVKKDD